ncbi:sedoheptulose 7-phosphate cyclase [Lichenicoccus sp.]|uniref:sedoheptulose 7-phosphate cyclase n=1 Tax=Lichenicoccus sp. TaxID=2781899 RepID=UPI003D125FC7
MASTVARIRRFLGEAGGAIAPHADVREAIDALLRTPQFGALVTTLIEAPAFSEALGRDFAESGAVGAISACRMLRGCLNMPLGQFFLSLGQVLSALEGADECGRARGAAWLAFADRVADSFDITEIKLLGYLTTVMDDEAINRRYRDLADDLVEGNPHALYPTSAYRACDGHVQTSADQRTVEAVMSFSTFSSIRVVDRVLDPADRTLRDIYRPLGRCVCIIDRNVEDSYGDELDAYFRHHTIKFEKLVYRAMEVDKGIATVERMLGDLKRVGIARHEPVLIMGGGVLADTGGLACALYGRNTPYVMLATSIVTGIDAGPSPRTCCDGFGYKNLLGAYHPPVVSITDRFFFKSLRAGWLRHGVAEIVKMSVVKNAALFADLEHASDGLVETRFGTMACGNADPMHALSQRILGGALKSYIEAEYDNLYETHQCRPHAYGHTWSPGFEIEAGLLHGHAVSVDMGFGAYLSRRAGWIGQDDFERILRLIAGYGLSLWHDILRDRGVMRESHRKIIQKRGGNLVAPLPKGGIGRCGYLNDLSETALFLALAEYEAICAGYPRHGRGIEPLCRDVGLEDPSTVVRSSLVAAD